MGDTPVPYPVESLRDPETLLDRDAVAVERVARGLDAESYEARRERYEDIDGVVQLGVTDGDGRVLLQDWNGTGEWAPPGGTVDPGEDWAAAARRSAERLTGVSVGVDGAVLVEDLRFERRDGSASFSAYGVSFVLSLAETAPSFREDPTVAPGSRFSGGDAELAWVSAVPDDTNENHVDHVDLFLRFAGAD
ncbi:NUDIX domain-containing protein [Halorubrum sp. SS7]|uniref:NUDIX domain-containing protein n=1 Tax=Halorubrum salinarum TaxID=2739057 RepID=A0A7D3XVX4_9EURY|nr:MULTISPECIES: NUDIX domain-containing protein [Halorubrum]QKG93284.1 NUDIX domain-containing protein [Halorubrum salinarum]TKX56992.1 NUDIX domain-containing protein [Halorubrum sp. SS7]